MKAFLIVLAIVALGLGLTITQSERRPDVQAICDQAHREVSGISERACGDAQNQTNTEYLCDSTNTHCWVESKTPLKASEVNAAINNGGLTVQ